MTRTINPDGRAQLEAAISARIDTGYRAARYDGDNGTTGGTPEGTPVELQAIGPHLPGCVTDGCTCPPRRIDPVSERASQDAADLQHALDVIARLEDEYAPIHRRQVPGIGPCPAGSCQDHWTAGIKLAAARKRYTGLCRMCGDFRKRNGYPIPPRVLQALNEVGGDWSHWRVKRAQRAS